MTDAKSSLSLSNGSLASSHSCRARYQPGARRASLRNPVVEVRQFIGWQTHQVHLRHSPNVLNPMAIPLKRLVIGIRKPLVSPKKIQTGKIAEAKKGSWELGGWCIGGHLLLVGRCNFAVSCPLLTRLQLGLLLASFGAGAVVTRGHCMLR